MINTFPSPIFKTPKSQTAQFEHHPRVEKTASSRGGNLCGGDDESRVLGAVTLVLMIVTHSGFKQKGMHPTCESQHLNL